MATLIKKCAKCGWEYDYRSPIGTCRMCHTQFTYGPCCKCGEITDLVDGKYCKHCRYKARGRTNEEVRRGIEQRHEVKEAFADFWLQAIANVPDDYPRLSNEQWLEACRYFGGCAKCGSADIDTRSYFVPFKFGGRYCDWNVIPLCEDCATAVGAVNNPMKLKSTWGGKDNYSRIINYLYDKLMKASKPNG